MDKIVYNLVSDSLRPKPLKRGERKTYCVYGSYDKKTGKVKRMLSALVFPNTDVVWDNEQGKYVPIALTSGVNDDGTPRLMELVITDKMGNVITVTGGKAKDHAIYEYFEMCNYNADNPSRDNSKEALIEVYSASKFAKQWRLEKIKKRDAVMIAEGLSDEEVRNWALSKGRSAERSMEVMRADVEKYAEDHADEFLGEGFSNEIQIEGKLRDAAKQGVIKLTKEKDAWVWADESKICDIKKGVGISQYKELLRYVINSSTGRDVMERIDKEVIR